LKPSSDRRRACCPPPAPKSRTEQPSGKNVRILANSVLRISPTQLRETLILSRMSCAPYGGSPTVVDAIPKCYTLSARRDREPACSEVSSDARLLGLTCARSYRLRYDRADGKLLHHRPARAIDSELLPRYCASPSQDIRASRQHRRILSQIRRGYFGERVGLLD
jgi:hypothetical protein